MQLPTVTDHHGQRLNQPTDSLKRRTQPEIPARLDITTSRRATDADPGPFLHTRRWGLWKLADRGAQLAGFRGELSATRKLSSRSAGSSR
ncbi:Protein of unknown function [Pyronema omphalodes CBS 100304]|uniref:Uncharacterized protein n=1 Tax=Pyronema omphalodes (strain CBS 100304) TaxID=1076935 RepID=U4LJM3_PYROM|nr:Protein of unknown function [Pyronema omphalodes CBS 100304]